MNKKITFLILLIFTNTLWATTEIAAPANDDFGNAIPISCGNNYIGSTLEATLDEDNAPDSTNPVVDLDAPNIWYSYTGTGTAEIITLDLCASGYDTSFLIYTGTSGNLTLVAANDDNEPQCGAGYRSYGTFQSDGTTTYYITITGYGPTDIGTVDLTISCLPAQAVLVPDSNFEQALIDLGIDSGTVNGYVLPAAVDQVVDLNVSAKNISDLTGIEAFTSLKTLDCSINNLTSLDVSQNLMLEDLKVFANQLTNLDISQNVALEELRVFDNSQLSNIEFPANGSLTHLTMSTNTQLTNIDFSEIPTLETLYAINCGFTSLDLSGNPALKILDLSQNPLLSLDLSANPALTNISCDNMSSLVYLNVQNGTNSTNVAVFNTLSTPNLSCIQVDDVTYSTSNWTQVDAGVNFAVFCDPVTYVPDDNFEQYLIDEGYDNILDNTVVIANINTIIAVDVSSKSIADLTGIEAFTALKTLDCDSNNLTNLDVSQNLALETLDVMSNSQLSNIELPVNGNLRFLVITNTQITNIDLTQTPALDNLYATNSGLTNLDLSGNPALATLVLGQNPLVSLDLSANPALAIFSCQNMSSLAYLNVQNGANTSMLSFNTLSNPSLSCIQVDDVAYSTSNWTQVDAGVNFAVFCDPVTYVPDDNFEQYLIDEGYDDVLDNHVITSNISSVALVNISNKSIADLTGIEDFTALQFLYALNNQLTNLDVTQNTALKVLQIGNNNISTLDLTQNTALENLNINANNISTIDLTQNAVLESLNINTNNISTIDLTQNPLLKTLRAGINPITTIDVTQNTALEDVTFYNIPLSTLDVSNNLNLERLIIELSPIATIDLTQNVALKLLTLYDTQIATIDVSNNLNLEQLFIDSEVLTAIDVSANVALKSLYIWDTLIPSVDVSNNPVFENLSIQGNSTITAVNVQNGNNSNFVLFDVRNIPNLTCIQVDDVAYSTSNWTLIDSQINFSEFCGDPIQLAAKVYLQGAMLQHTDGFMRTDLKDNNYISSTSSPYADGIDAADNVFLATGQNKIVDWIWIELRDATDPTIIIDGKSALLQRDGDIVGAEGDASTPVSFNKAAGDYYVVLKHRNHLGIMSSTTFTLSNTVTTVDFTNGNNQITYGANAQTTFGMPTNTVGMWSGNVNGDTVVQYSGTTPDVPAILSRVLNDAGNFLNFPTYTVSGYDANDVNMDGNTQYTGTTPDTPFILQNILAHPGNFLNFSTYQIVEQLPQNE